MDLKTIIRQRLFQGLGKVYFSYGWDFWFIQDDSRIQGSDNLAIAAGRQFIHKFNFFTDRTVTTRKIIHGSCKVGWTRKNCTGCSFVCETSSNRMSDSQDWANGNSKSRRGFCCDSAFQERGVCHSWLMVCIFSWQGAVGRSFPDPLQLEHLERGWSWSQWYRLSKMLWPPSQGFPQVGAIMPD